MQSMFSGRHFMHVRRTLALALVVPLLLAGCTDEPTPKIPEPTTPSPTTPSPLETEQPEQESAEDFIRRWVDLSNEMQSTGETGEYLEVSSKCGACRRVAERVESVFASGGFVRTKGWKILTLTDKSGGGRRQVWDVRVNSAATVFKESSSGEEQRLPGGEIVYRFRLSASAPWTVTQLTQVAS